MHSTAPPLVADLATPLLGSSLPIRVESYDGSRNGPPATGAVVCIRTQQALHRVLARRGTHVDREHGRNARRRRLQGARHRVAARALRADAARLVRQPRPRLGRCCRCSHGGARAWRLYMIASQSFESSDIGVNQVLAVRPGPLGQSGMPLTRAQLPGFDTAQ